MNDKNAPTEGDGAANEVSLTAQLQRTQQKLAALTTQVERGLRFCHVVATNNQGALHETKAALNALGHVLTRQGKIAPNEVFEASKAYASTTAPSSHRVHLGLDVDKYSEQAAPVEIDCEARWSLCRAACCRLGYALGTQDLDEGVIKWNYGTPYAIKREADGWCTHLQSGCKCGVREQRPLSCRRYDCSSNPDIWIDFSQRIINPKVADLPPLDRE